ncbi:RNA-binding protein 28-like [Apostichopus japonicus]|uniref:RNA-binding protein 28-like n=1 Tax=Stichopus japonicus TaxID=307972 RepID=UPI003AB57687
MRKRKNEFELQEKRKKMEKIEEKDKRNLYLPKEGFIRPGTEAAAGLSKSDIAKRSNVEASKVMRDKDKLREDKKGKPLGYGIVSFTEDRHALEALRTVNNNRQLIVGFPFKNKKALEKRQRQADKSKVRERWIN